MSAIDSITPSDEQNRAIKAIHEWFEAPDSPQEFFLDGQAGTGKSTTAQIAVRDLGDINIAHAAYTAKAASVMRQKGARSASTIHRLIYIPRTDRYGKIEFILRPESHLEDIDLFVIDEVSMVNDSLADDLRSFDKKILVLGDVIGQLPPISGEGAFTRRDPDFRLLELNRFAMEDPINAIAQRARQGQRLFPAFSEGNCKLVWYGPDTAREALYQPETQIICGRHKVRYAITKNMRAKKGYEDSTPRVGEPLLCCQNNYHLGILNGEFFTASYVNDGGTLEMCWGNEEDDVYAGKEAEPTEVSRHLFDAHYSDKPPPKPAYDREVAWMDFGYVITAHKAQGSEWPHVTIIDDGDSFKWSGVDFARRWRYTAITRASEGLTMLLRK